MFITILPNTKVCLNLRLQRKSSEGRFCCYKTTAGKLSKWCKAGTFPKQSCGFLRGFNAAFPYWGQGQGSLWLWWYVSERHRAPCLKTASSPYWSAMASSEQTLTPAVSISPPSFLLALRDRNIKLILGMKALWWSAAWSAESTMHPLLQGGRSF